MSSEISDITSEKLNLADLKRKSPKDLLSMAEDLEIENASTMRKGEMMFQILRERADEGWKVSGDGVLEVLQDGFGFLRSADSSYLAGPDDIYVSPSQIRRFNLRTGDSISGLIRPPKDGERYFALLKVGEINYEAPENARNKVLFENLTPYFPTERLRMEQGTGSTEDLTARIIDMVAPIGKGQRGLIVSPPKAGKTMLLQNIATSIAANHPECYLMVLLIDERPEEVTDMQRSVQGEVVASTFDEPAQQHVHVAEMVIEKAKRLVEHGRDVVILLDSITRLARAHNAVVPHSGKILSGGVDANALQRPKRFEGKATITEEEAKEIAEYWANNLAKDAAPSDPNRGAPEKGGTEIYVPEFAGAAGGVGGYNAFYVDIGESNFMIDGRYPTSIITSPENGRLPEMSEHGKAQAMVLHVTRYYAGSTNCRIFTW